MTKYMAILLILLISIAIPAKDAAREQIDPAIVLAKIDNIKHRFERVKKAVEFLRPGLRQKYINSIEELERQFDAIADAYRADADANFLTIKSLGVVIRLRAIEMEVYSIAGKRKLSIAHVQKALERTDRLLLKADKAIQKSGSSDNNNPALRQATDVQTDAKQAFTENSVLEAFQLTLKAREILGQAVANVLEPDDMDAIADREKAFWDETNEMIENAEADKNTKGNIKTTQTLERAKKFQEQAAKLLDAGKPVLAMKESRAARRIVLSLRGAEPAGETIKNRIEQVETKFNQALARISKSSNANAKTILLKGEEHLNKAKAFAADGNNEAARVQLLVAVKIIARSVDMLEEKSEE